MGVSPFICLYFQDVGYGSVRSRTSEVSDSSRNLESIDWSSPNKAASTSEIKLQVPEKVSVFIISRMSIVFFPLFKSEFSPFFAVHGAFSDLHGIQGWKIVSQKSTGILPQFT